MDELLLDDEPPWRTYASEQTASRSRAGWHGRGDLSGSETLFPHQCFHPPQCLLKSNEGGWTVWAGAGADCTARLQEFDLLLNLTGTSVFDRHTVGVRELAHWEVPSPIPEIVLDWPDMGVVELPRNFWTELVEHLNRSPVRLLVFCVGGHGRTGTAMASIMVACGWGSADAIAWVRTNYCPRAIETHEQELYVRMMAGEIPFDVSRLFGG